MLGGLDARAEILGTTLFILNDAAPVPALRGIHTQ